MSDPLRIQFSLILGKTMVDGKAHNPVKINIIFSILGDTSFSS